MFKIEDLLSLFPNEKTREMLIYSYNLSQKKNKTLSDSVFERLLLLKEQDPDIDIILDTTKDDPSYYDPAGNTIYIHDLSIEAFFHELTHLLSYNYLRFQVPNEYYSFKINFIKNPDNTNLIVHLLDLCERKKAELSLKFLSKETLNLYNDKTLNKMNNVQQKPQHSQLDLIFLIEDIIDSIFDGQSASHGIVSIRDNETITIKAQKTAGHGCEYFANSSYQFEEILANYLAIKITDPNNEVFNLLKIILGTKFISFLDQRCNEICVQISKTEINNNNIYKK